MDESMKASVIRRAARSGAAIEVLYLLDGVFVDFDRVQLVKVSEGFTPARAYEVKVAADE